MAESVDCLWKTQEAAAYLRCSPATLHQWRWQGRGPKASRAGGQLLWRKSDIDRWLEAQAS